MVCASATSEVLLLLYSVYSYRYLSPAYRNDHFVFIDTTSTPKNVGLTRGLALDVWMNAIKGKLVVMFSELNGEPLFENGPKVVNECVVIVRSIEALRYKSWSEKQVLDRDSLIYRVKLCIYVICFFARRLVY